MRLLLVSLACIFTAYGQVSTGSIRGTVSDPSGAVVPDTVIVLTNIRTGVTQSVRSDGSGNYLIDFVPTGEYKITAEMLGFKKFERENITLDMSRQLRVDIPIPPGLVTETVSVNATTSLVETETGVLSTTVENQQVTSLPLLGRDPQSFRLVAPGVVNGANGPVTQGGLVRTDPYYIDGVNSSSHVWSGNPVNPNPDVIQEFKTLTNSFSAEYGEASGAVMTSTTKSGTNSLHGSVFEFLRNNELNAGNFFSHARPVVRRNQFGGTVGGPVIKNKTFFFFDMQFTRQRQAASFTNLTVPIAAFRKGDFSRLLGTVQPGVDALGRQVLANQIFDPQSGMQVGNTVVRNAFPGNIIPTSLLNPVALKVQELYPAAQLDTPFANFSTFGTNPVNQYEYDIKMDHSFSASDKISGRFSRRQNDQDQPTAFGRIAGGPAPGTLGPGFSHTPGRQAVLNHVHVFSPSMTNNLNLGWFQVYPKRTIPGSGVISESSLGITGMPNADEKVGMPYFNFVNYHALGATTDTLFLELQASNSLTDVFSMIRGKHNVRIGGEARHLRIDNLQPGAQTTAWYFSNLFTDQRGFANTGFDYASFLLGLPNDMNYSLFPDYIRTRSSVYALFVQDDIRVSRKLTLNVGLRWDAPLWYHEVHNRSGVFDLNKGQYQVFGQDGFRDTPWKNNWKNFGPRLGFAYTPGAKSSLVVRGGFGMFAAGTLSSGASGFLPTSPIFADADVGRYRTVDQVTNKITLGPIPYVPADKTGRNATSVSIYPDSNPMSYFEQYNLNVQNEIKGILLEVGYAGSRGVHLPYGAYNLNAIPISQAATAAGRFIAPFVPYPQFPNGVSVQTWIGSSNYNSLQLKAEKRFSSGLGFIAAYTFSKLIDVGQLGYRDPLLNRDLDRGIGPDNAPNRFTVAYNYRLPFGKGNRWVTHGPLQYVAGGWELNGFTTFQSGLALMPGISTNTCQCGNNAARPNVTSDPRISPSSRDLNHWYDISKFSVPAQFTIGNSGRGLVYGPHTHNWDLNAAKTFPIPGREGMKLEFRAEFYNLFNTPQFSDPNMTVNAGTAGRVTGSKNERQGQMALKLYF